MLPNLVGGCNQMILDTSDPDCTADPCNTAAEMQKFFAGLTAWCQADADQGYKCGVWKLYKGVAWENCLEGNTSQPDINNTSWKRLGNIDTILRQVMGSSEVYALTLPFWEGCFTSPWCACSFAEGACVVDLVPSLDENGDQIKDKCGNLQFEPRIFTSLEPKNEDRPLDGAMKDPKTWDGGDSAKDGFDGRGYTVCQYLQRNVLKDENGLLQGPGADETRKCFISCDAPDGETIEWFYRDADGNEVVVPDGEMPPAGVTRHIRAVFEDIHVTGIDDSGTTTVITLSNGTTIEGPEVDQDDFATSLTNTPQANGDILVTLTMNSGAVLEHTIPAAATSTEVTTDEDTVQYGGTGNDIRLLPPCCTTIHDILPTGKKYGALVEGEHNVAVPNTAKGLEETWNCLRQHRMCPDAYVRLVLPDGFTGGTQVLAPYDFARQVFITAEGGTWNVGSDGYIGYAIIASGDGAQVQIGDMTIDNSGNGGGGTGIQTANGMRTRGLGADDWSLALTLNNFQKGIVSLGGDFVGRNVTVTNVDTGIEAFSGGKISITGGTNLLQSKSPKQSETGPYIDENAFAGVRSSGNGSEASFRGTVDGFRNGCYALAMGWMDVGGCEIRNSVVGNRALIMGGINRIGQVATAANNVDRESNIVQEYLGTYDGNLPGGGANPAANPDFEGGNASGAWIRGDNLGNGQ